MNKKCKFCLENTFSLSDLRWLSIHRPPVPVGMDAQGRYLPGEVPKLYGGDCLNYIMVRGMELVEHFFVL